MGRQFVQRAEALGFPRLYRQRREVPKEGSLPSLEALWLIPDGTPGSQVRDARMGPSSWVRPGQAHRVLGGEAWIRESHLPADGSSQGSAVCRPPAGGGVRPPLQGPSSGDERAGPATQHSSP